MSDKEEEPVIELEEGELSKEERLEAARKRYEELKKKKKGKKKGKKEKKDKSEDSPVPEDNDEPETEAVDTEAVATEAAATETVDTEASIETETPVDPEAVDTESVETKKPVESESANTPEIAPTTSDVTNPPVPSADASSPSEIASLKDTIFKHEKTIKKLRDENTDLKLEKMDMKDKISELQATIETLKTGNGASQHQPPVRKLEPAKPIITTNKYASASKQDLNDFSNLSDFRERLMVWKHWQVDMTSWNSVYATEKVTL
ncbi:hypothetical protein CANTEDRAFT_114455 [Yamadazyma tenuis ATCC 10573]|uniref:Uncharacterized protein n=2 Tax=Candida tenuis TaxID=2315449 RepID=G3B545_CANTC|nr:uncharacterized protein CANTEDRAFT_114455 [Yamadazyma tenuis ATCC 10573]EGV63135.1 hypothetical protein CANTEDRAFT_114455 [Yamadazyma tenuis ATCC 10573]